MNSCKENKQLSHGTFLDFTPNNEYKDPLQKATKRLFKNNQSSLSDFKTFQMFDNENKESTLHSRSRTKSSINLKANDIKPQEKKQSNLTQEVKLFAPNDPSLNTTSRKDFKYSVRNNMESHSYLNDLSKKIYLISLIFFIFLGMRSSSTSFFGK